MAPSQLLGEGSPAGPAPRSGRRWVVVATITLALLLATAVNATLVTLGVLSVTSVRSASTVAEEWSSNVWWTALSAGSCIDGSFDSDLAGPHRPFNLEADYFGVVDCSTDHVAQILTVVDVPNSTSWDLYGTLDGPTQVAADAWVDDMCSSLGALVREYRSASGADLAFSEVRAIHGAMGQRFLGYCVLFDSAGLPLGALDVDAVRRAAVGE